MATLGTRYLVVLDGIAAAISTAWQPADPDSVVRDDIQEETLATMEGRRACVFEPKGEKGCFEAERANRGEVINGFKASLRLYEKFTDPGRPTKAWLDVRKQWVDTIYNAIDKVTPGDYLLSSLWTHSLEITELADEDAVNSNKLFFCEMEVEFREIAAG